MANKNLEALAKKVLPDYLELSTVTQGKQKYYAIERIRTTEVVNEKGKKNQVVYSRIPATNGLVDEKQLDQILTAIDKQDMESFMECIGCIRKKGMFYRLFEPKNNKSKKEPGATPQGTSGTRARADNKKPKANDNKANEPKAKDEEKKDEKKEDKKEEQKEPNNNKSNKEENLSAPGDHTEPINEKTAEEQAKQDLLDNQNQN